MIKSNYVKIQCNETFVEDNTRISCGDILYLDPYSIFDYENEWHGNFYADKDLLIPVGKFKIKNFRRIL